MTEEGRSATLGTRGRRGPARSETTRRRTDKRRRRTLPTNNYEKIKLCLSRLT
jgi:hypothetical protein